MKKSLIALAVAAALPVAAQAGTTISGSVEATATLGTSLSTAVESALSIASTEVLTNGMTATASMNVLSGTTQGTVGLSGDFGTLSAGSSEGTNETDPAVPMTGVSYTGSFAGLSVNAAQGDYNQADADWVAAMGTEYTKYGASYDFNGLALAANNTNGTNKVTASYAFGDLTVSGSKSAGANAVVKAAYSATLADLAVSVDASSDDSWNLDATYTLGGIALTIADGDDEDVTISGKYTADALTVSVASDSDVTVSYDMGNADLELVRTVGASTTVSYKVSF